MTQYTARPGEGTPGQRSTTDDTHPNTTRRPRRGGALIALRCRCRRGRACRSCAWFARLAAALGLGRTGATDWADLARAVAARPEGAR